MRLHLSRRDFDKRRAKAKEFDDISIGERYTEKIIRQRRGRLGSVGTAKPQKRRANGMLGVINRIGVIKWKTRQKKS